MLNAQNSQVSQATLAVGEDSPDNKYKPAYPCGEPVAYIKALAADMAQTMNYDPEKPISKLLEKYGGKLRELAVMPPQFRFASSCIVVEGVKDFTIYTLELSETQRRRFDIAHELGHYILHYLLPRTNDASKAPLKLAAGREKGGREEAEANWFAMAFLINEERFLEKFTEFNGNKYLLGNYFSVSPSTIIAYGKSVGKYKEEVIE